MDEYWRIIWALAAVTIIASPFVFFFSSYYVLKRFFKIGRVKNTITSLIIASLLLSFLLTGITLFYGLPIYLFFPWSPWTPTGLIFPWSDCLPPDDCGGAISVIYCRMIQIWEYELIFAAALVIVVPTVIERIKKVTKKS